MRSAHSRQAQRPTRRNLTLRAVRAAALVAALLPWPTSCSRQPTASGKAAQQIAEIERLSERVEQLQQTIDRDQPRVAAYRRLEYLGSQPPIPGETTTFEIISAPNMPDPQRSDYPDCSAVFLCEWLDADQAKTGVKALVVACVFHHRQSTRAAAFGVGTIVQSQLLPWEQMPDGVKSIQRIDETDVFDLPMFAAIGPEQFHQSIATHTRPPDGNAPSQQQCIARDIATIEARAAAHGGMVKWHLELEPARQELARKQRAAGGPLVKDRRIAMRSTYHIGHVPNEQWPAPQVAYFTNLRDQLADRGIDLIVVPFPEKEQLASLEFLDQPPADGIVHVGRLQWLLALLQAGIEVIDLVPALRAAAPAHDNVYYDGADGHPANGAIVAAAGAIAERLRRYGDVEPDFAEMRTRKVRHAIPKRYRLFPSHAHNERCYTATKVMQSDGSAFPSNSHGSPILLIGDSFTSVPHSYGVPNADLPSHVVKELGVLIRHITIGGSAPQLMVHLAKAGPEAIEGLRVVVYVFRENYMFRHSETEAKFRWQAVDLPR